jgi:hypothetical protein
MQHKVCNVSFEPELFFQVVNHPATNATGLKNIALSERLHNEVRWQSIIS